MPRSADIDFCAYVHYRQVVHNIDAYTMYISVLTFQYEVDWNGAAGLHP